MALNRTTQGPGGPSSGGGTTELQTHPHSKLYPLSDDYQPLILYRIPILDEQFHDLIAISIGANPFALCYKVLEPFDLPHLMPQPLESETTP